MAVDHSMDEAAREGNTSALQSMDGETPVSKKVEWGTPSLYVEGGTPFESEGATPTLFVEGEIPGKFEGATPCLFSEGETPFVSEGEILEKPEEETPKKSEG